ncbi:uncharacterized protein LY89DRAFT_446379 [Mollisia scopiformis]|uniref:BZIP domain-containing protein n=1 Tax=Mollisia scopiformis TaxID=149040 RepID=A0A194XL99_MOLSC|nr:uncharacterized protein LY89DRAFT_446379 [Mollisia scopiformis]KUJ20552.1 hypothetical protein LY89DRAFT_446379 [Mollisia scopiformis]
MTLSATTTTRSSGRYSLKTSMDSSQDKEERKREYNRLAQREFRRRRKEHLKNLEQAQKEQSSEQSEEIERLRYQNDELRRENEALRAQIYGSSSSSSHLMSGSINVPSISDARQYSLSPSLSGTSMSGTGSPPATMASDMMPMAALSLTSSMLTPPMQAYADPSALSSQPYSMVHPSGLRHNSQSSPESSGFRSSRSTMGPSFQSLNLSQSVEAAAPLVPGQQRRSSGQPPTMVMVPYDRNKAKNEILDLFRPLYSDPSVTNDSSRHLTVLRTMSETLPPSLKPSKAQLETPHYYGIDMIASSSLRERLMTVTTEVARSFCADLGIIGGERDEVGQVIIWGDEPLNEMSWELSQPLLERWGWLLGTGWTQRANFWRRQRGAPLLTEW